MDFERVESRREDFYVRIVEAKKFGGMQFFPEEFINPSNEKCFFEIIIRLYLDFASEKLE